MSNTSIEDLTYEYLSQTYLGSPANNFQLCLQTDDFDREFNDDAYYLRLRGLEIDFVYEETPGGAQTARIPVEWDEICMVIPRKYGLPTTRDKTKLAFKTAVQSIEAMLDNGTILVPGVINPVTQELITLLGFNAVVEKVFIVNLRTQLNSQICCGITVTPGECVGVKEVLGLYQC